MEPRKDAKVGAETDQLKQLENPSTEFDKTSHEEVTDKDQDQGVMPHATMSAVRVVEEIAQGVKEIAKAAVDETVAWVEQKTEKLSNEDEYGVGPYASPGLCAPSDLDAIAIGILPAMPFEDTEEKHEARKLEQDETTAITNEVEKPTEEQKK